MLRAQDSKDGTSHAVRALEHLVCPRSVAIIGASTDEDGMGGAPLANLQEQGYEGDVYLVNPRRQSIRGLPCLHSPAEIPIPVDTAVIVTPSTVVASILKELEGRAKTATVVSAGFHGEDISADLGSIAARAGIRLLGPNTTGVLNANDQYCPRAARNHPEELRPGQVALVAQSGGVANTTFNRALAHGMAIGLLISTGDSADITVWDAAEYCVRRPDIDTVLMVVEADLPGADVERLAATAAQSSAKVVLYKTAVTRSGRAAAVTHTGSISSTATIGLAMARALGIAVVHDIDALWQTGWLLSSRMHCNGEQGAAKAHGTSGGKNGVAVIALSGGLGVIAADVADELGLALPTPEAELRRDVSALIGIDEAEVGNPFDPGPAILAQPEACAKACRRFIDGMDAEQTVLVTPVMQGRVARRMLKDLVPMVRAVEKPVAIGAHSAGLGTQEALDQLIETTVPVFDGIRPTLEAVAGTLEAERFGVWASPGARRQQPMALVGPTAALHTLSYAMSRQWVAEAGVPISPGTVVASVDTAVAARREHGPTLVMKGSVAGQAHKVAAGLVTLNVASEEEVRKEFERIDRLASRMKGYDGIVCEAVVPEGVDFLVGGKIYPEYGPFITIGTGGALANYAGDAAISPAHVAAELAREAIKETIAGRAMAGWHKGDELIEQLISLIQALGDRLSNGDIAEFDVNPMRCGMNGSIVALDALVVARRSS